MSETHDEICDAFEAAWATGEFIPEVRDFVQRTSNDTQAILATELIKIDLERRWAFPDVTCTVPEYVGLLGFDLGKDALRELLEKEFCLRLRKGARLREEDLLEHSKLVADVSTVLADARARVDWPSVSLSVDGRTRVQVELDRPVVVGRQADGEPPPESVLTYDDERRLVVVGSEDTSVSRKQLRIEIRDSTEILLSNLSANRAIGVEDVGVLNPGQEFGCHLPVSIPLTNRRMLLIMEAESHRI